jgi:release factor glutamine methyltransferase
LQPEVREYEPSAALYAGKDGLDVIRRLIGGAAGYLEPGGVLIFEFGFGQAGAVRDLLAAERSLALADIRRDLQAIERTAIVKRVRT